MRSDLSSGRRSTKTASLELGLLFWLFLWVNPTWAKAPSKHSSHLPTETKAEKATKEDTSLPLLLKEVEKKYAAAKTLTANYSQTEQSEATGHKKETSGTLLVKQPNKFKWEVLKPEGDRNLSVTDGKTFWLYTPPFDATEPGAVKQTKSSNVNSRLLTAFLSGNFSSVKGLKIQIQTPTRFLMTPKKGSAGTISQIEINIDPEKKLIQKVGLNHLGGNRSDISLTAIELGKPMADSLFHFVPPPNTDRSTD